jgi:hypothetical protein
MNNFYILGLNVGEIKKYFNELLKLTSTNVSNNFKIIKINQNNHNIFFYEKTNAGIAEAENLVNELIEDNGAYDTYYIYLHDSQFDDKFYSEINPYFKNCYLFSTQQDMLNTFKNKIERLKLTNFKSIRIFEIRDFIIKNIN